MSSSGSGGSSTTTQELPSWAQPFAQQLLQRSADLSNTTQPAYGGQTVAGLNGTQTGAISGLAGAAGNQANTSSAATDYYNSLVGQPNGMSISNPYAGNVTAANATAAPSVSASTAANAYADPANNPYLASTVNAANQDLTTAYNNTTGASTLAQFRNAGAFGGTAQQQQTTANQKQLSDQVSQQTSGMYNAAYNTAAGVAAQNAAQQNAVGLANQSQANNIGLANQSAQNTAALANQSLGTSANTAYNNQASSNYYNQQGAIANALNGSTAANSAASSLYGNQYTGGAAQQTNSQDQLNAEYQAWLQQINQPYTQLSTLSSGLSGALGSGTGITTQQSSGGSGSSLAQLLGLGAAGAGIYSSFK